jgi:hypothetical protein
VKGSEEKAWVDERTSKILHKKFLNKTMLLKNKSSAC